MSEGVPIDVNGQRRLFDPALTQAEMAALLPDLRLRANRTGLFAEPPSEGEVNWP